MRFVSVAAVASLVLAVASRASAFEVCINGPSSYGGSIDSAGADAIIAMQPRCVRLPYRQDVWSAPDDPTPKGPGKLGIFATYDALVARYLAAGIEVHMLVHPESINADAHVINTDAGRAQWVSGVTKIIDHFKPTVRRFELINEPNNWDASKQATNPADAFAATLADAYTAVKVAHPGDGCWNVDLVSGALFAFHQSDGTGGSASDYLAQTYAAGIASHGWDGIKQKTGSYPLDGIGWHIYMEETDAAGTAALLDTYLSQVWATVSQYEGAASPKRIWISELGFGTNDTAAQNDSQAQSLDHVFDALSAQPHVAMGMWFTYQDFDAAGWGLYKAGGFDAAHARPSRDHFVSQGATKAEGLWAKVAIDAPHAMHVGETATVHVAATNLGSQVWKAADKVRLGAGPGCPETPAANALAWKPASGYANSVTDARAFLDAADSVAARSTKVFALEITAPSAPGTYVVSARMVKEGVSWFGTAGEVAIVVTAASSGGDAGSTGDAGTPPVADASLPGEGGSSPPPAATPGASSDAGCGCRVGVRTGGAGLSLGALALGLVVVLRRRR